MRHPSGSIYSRTKTCVASWLATTSLISKQTQGLLLKLVSCRKQRTEENKEQYSVKLRTIAKFYNKSSVLVNILCFSYNLQATCLPLSGGVYLVLYPLHKRGVRSSKSEGRIECQISRPRLPPPLAPPPSGLSVCRIDG